MAVASARAVVSLKEKGHFQTEDARVNKYTLADELPAKISELHLRRRSMATPAPSYTVRKLTAADKDATIKFLDRFFFRDEPMNKAVKLLDTPEARCIELEEYAAATLEDMVSLAAVDEKGEFVGVIINGIVNREDAAAKDEECSNEKFARILRVLEHLNENARIWDVLPPTCKRVIEIRIVSTHTAWRGRGLMKALTEETERLANDHGATALRMDATSAFSAAAAERLGYLRIYTVKYSDLPDAPKPEPPHLEARVIYYTLAMYDKSRPLSLNSYQKLLSFLL